MRVAAVDTAGIDGYPRLRASSERRARPSIESFTESFREFQGVSGSFEIQKALNVLGARQCP
jgi:hypothetical protein